MRLDRPVALLAAIACVGPLIAADQAPIMVKDIAVQPMANLTARDGTVTVHPKALLGVGYNSNIFTETDDEEGDVFIRGLAGMVVDWRLNPHSSLAFNGELEALNYVDSDNDEGNLFGGLLTGDYRWREQNRDLRIHAGYARFDDPLIQTGEQILRQSYDGSATLALSGSEMRTVLELGAGAVDYLEDGIGFSDTSRDNTTYRLTGRVGRTTARDTFYYVMLGVDRSDYWDNIQYNDSNGITAGLGAQVRLGERSTLTAEAGATYRVYEDNFGGIAAYDDEQVLAPYISVAARWPWESGSHVGLNLFSRIDESITANAAWVYGAAVDGRYRLLARSGLFGSLAAYHSEDSGDSAAIVNETRDTFEATAGVDHEISRGVVGRLKVSYADSSADIGNDWTRYIASFDVAVAF
jgi:hypothetical protein